MAGQVLGFAGAFVGGWFFGPLGAQLGYMAGSMIGNAIDPPKGTTTEGPRMDDNTSQTVAFGTPIPQVFGTILTMGNVIFAEPMKEHVVKQTTGGSKGPSGPENTAISYEYTQTFGISIASNEILSLLSIKADLVQMYTTADNVSSGAKLTSSEVSGYFRIYPGNYEQMPDPSYEAYKGVGRATAFRGTAYIVFTDFPITKFNGRIPSFQFEVVSKSAGFKKQGTVVSLQNIQNNGYITSQLGTNIGSVGEYLRNEYYVNNKMFTHDLFSVDNKPQVYNVLTTKSNMSSTQFYINGLRYYDGYNPKYSDLLFDLDYDKAKITDFYTSTFLDIYKSPAHFYFNSTTEVQRIHACISRIENENAIYFNSRFITNPISDLSGYNETANSCFATSKINIANQADTVLYAVDENLGISGKYIKGFTISEDKNYFIVFYGDSNLNTTSKVYYKKCVLNGNDLEVVESGEFEDELMFAGFCNSSFIYPISGNSVNFNYNSFDGKYLWLINSSVTAGLSLSIYEFENKKIIKKGFLNIDVVGSQPNFYAKNGLLYYNDETNSAILSANEVVTTNQIYLNEIIEAQLKLAKIKPEKYDLSEIADVKVDGYKIGSISSARANIETLATPYFFDIIDDGAQLIAKKRGRNISRTINSDDFIVSAESTGNARSLFKTQYIQELSIPKEVQVAYYNKGTGYTVGAQYARSKDDYSTEIVSLNIPIVLTDDHASNIATTILNNFKLEKEVLEFSTSLDFIDIEPTDVVRVYDYENEEYIVRIIQKDIGDDNQINFKAVRDQQSSYLQNTKGGKAESQKVWEVKYLEDTELTLMNLPYLNESQPDDNLTYIAASAKTAGKWNGAIVYKSIDNSNFELLRNVSFDSSQNSYIGICSNALLSSDCFTIDTSSKIRVTMRDVNFKLYSVDYDILLSTQNNYALINNEVVQFATATQVSDGVYDLSNFVRGIGGTDVYANSHQEAEKFVLLDMSKIGLSQEGLSAIDNQYFYKGISIGQNFAKADNKTFINNGQTIKPLAPYSFLLKKPNNDFYLSWFRRARKNAGLLNNIDVPLDENSEIYTIEIYSDNTYSTILNEYQVNNIQNFTYTTAMQNADFGSTQTRIYSKIYQISSRVGKGLASFPINVNI